MDQGHEMLNKEVKGDGGIIGLTQNDDALDHWLTIGSEVKRLLRLHEEVFHQSTPESANHHHEDTTAFQEKFAADVSKLESVYKETGNPFLEASEDLIALVTGVVAPSEAAANVLKAEALGRTQYQEYCQDRLLGDVSIHENISKNNLQIFKSAKVRKQNRNLQKIGELKTSCSLFSRLFIATQTAGREMNLNDFFSHENLAYPPAISECGDFYTGTKSELLKCFETISKPLETCLKCEVIIVDGLVMINFLLPDKTEQKTFGD